MRVALALCMLAACTGDPDPCEGIDGRCVALRVESEPTFDEIELGLTIAQRQSIVVRATAGTAAPFIVPIAVSGEPRPLDVVAVGRTQGTVIAAGAVTVESPDDRIDATLVLLPPQTCVNSGRYCGGDKLYGDPDILYVCRTGRVPALEEVCERGCTVAPPGTDDFCTE